MSFQQVRNEILFSNDYAKLIRYFIDDRLSNIDTFDPNSLFSNPVKYKYKLVLHICPIEYFYNNTSLHKFDKQYIQTINLSSDSPGEIFSLDGLYLVNYIDGYSLINRNGTLEYVTYINHDWLSKDKLGEIICCIHRSLLRFSLLNVKSSVIVSLALIEAKGIKIYQPGNYHVREYIINNNYVHMPLIEIKPDLLEKLSVNLSNKNNLYKDIFFTWKAIESLFDFIYQSFGCPESLVRFDEKDCFL